MGDGVKRTGPEVTARRLEARRVAYALTAKDIAEWVARGCPQVPLSVQVQWVLAVIGLPAEMVKDIPTPCPQARRLLRWARQHRERFRVEYEQKFRPPEPRESSFSMPKKEEETSGQDALDFLESLKKKDQ